MVFPEFKRYIAAFLAFLLLSLGTYAAEAPIASLGEDSAPDISHVSAAAVYNLENETLVFGFNEDEVLPTASFAKIMTALCAYEILYDRLDDIITVEYSMIKDASGNQVGFYIGEEVRVRDLFGGLLTRGANDCAYLLCHAAKGSVEDFVAYMNEKAAVFGMSSTVYKNPTGMHEEGMVTTAQDTLIAARRFYENEFLTSLAGTVTYTIPKTNSARERQIYNRNALVSRVSETAYFDSRIIGINAGSTTEAGYYAASAVKNDELTYIIAVLGGREADGKNSAYTSTGALASYALDGFGYTEVIKTSEMICEVPVRLSTDADYVTLVPASGLKLYLPVKLDVKSALDFAYSLEYEVLEAPVTEGQVVGKYTVSKDSAVLGTVDLVATNSVARSEFLAALDAIERFTKNPFFLAALAAFVLVVILNFALRGIMKSRRRKRNYRRR